MLTGVQVVLLGGDARQLEVIRKLTELDAQVTVAGFDQLHTPLDGAVKAEMGGELFDSADALILPAVGTDDDGKIIAVFSDRELILDR